VVKPWLYSLLGLAGFLVGAYLLIVHGLPLVLPFVLAVLIAELIEPVVSLLTSRGRIPRAVAVTLILLLFVGLIVTAVTVSIGRLAVEIQNVVGNLPYLYALASDVGSQFAEQFGRFNATLPASIQLILTHNLARMEESLNASLPGMARTLGYFTSLPAVLTNLFFTLIATFFMSRDRRKIYDFLLALFPKVWQTKIHVVKVDVWARTMGFAKAHLTLILITMVQTMIGLSIIHVNYALSMGILIGLADMLPVLGPASVYIPWILYSLIFGSKIFGIKLLVIYALVTAVRQLIEPKLIGDRIGLHPLAILFSIYLGFQAFGGLGFAIGPLLAILLKAMIESGLLPIFQDPPIHSK
jgi:sporulation integral membrane protein YtvI